VLGEIFFHHSQLTFLGLLAIVVTAWFLHTTPAGLMLCMTGKNPMAVEPQG
jgi:general nucleoside transport system permease protein